MRPNFSTSKLFSLSAFSKILLPPGFSLLVFSFLCYYTLLTERSDVPLSKRLKLPIFLGGISSPLFRQTPLLQPIPVPLSILVIYGVMLLVFINGLLGMPIIVFRPKLILILSHLSRLSKEKSWSPFPCLSM